MKIIVSFLSVVVLFVGGVFMFGDSLQFGPNSEILENKETLNNVSNVMHDVVLTEDGFVPAELTIKKGDMVMWRSDRSELYWPASNIHPSHTLYPEFDPKEPVEPDMTWSFVFKEIGGWRYHDHLAPYFTGTINVTE